MTKTPIHLGPADILALTGLTAKQTEHISSLTEPPDRPGRAGRPPALSHHRRVVLVLTALRTNLTERALAAIFQTSQPTVHRTIAALLPRVAALFQPDRSRGTLMLDGTLIPVHDHRIAACSKNYRRSVNTQIVATTARRVVQVGQAWPGNRNDIVVTRHTITLPTDRLVLADGAYRNLPGATTPPKGKRKNAHRRVRARIEHTIARLKDWQILRQCRRRGEAINHALHAVAYLHNLRQQHL